MARWRAWLRRSHARSIGAWVLIAKKATRPGMPYADALEEALCWGRNARLGRAGWIDGKLHRHDERYFSLWFSPRRPRSIWSLSNRRTAERLAAEGRMQPAGLARISEAKANGRWQAAYSSAAVPRVSPEIRRCLENAGALPAFRALSASRRLQLLHWIAQAKREQTRARRIAEMLRDLT